MPSHLLSRRAWILPAALALLLAPGCSDDDDDRDDRDEIPDDIQTLVDAWRDLPMKTCSLEAIFGGLPPSTHVPREGWDLAAARKAYDPNLVRTDGDSLFIIGSLVGFEADTAEYDERRTRRTDDTTTLEAHLHYGRGRCTLTIGGQVVYDEPLGRAEVAAAFDGRRTGQAVTLVPVPARDLPTDIRGVVSGTTLIDFSGVATAVADAMNPPALQNADALAQAAGAILRRAPDRVKGMLVPSRRPFTRDLLIPQGLALPDIGVERTGLSEDVGYRSRELLTDAELATLRQAAELRLVWPYSRGTVSAQITDLEIVLRRTGDLTYALASIRKLGVEDKADAPAAACLARRLERLRTRATMVPAGRFEIDGAPCGRFTVDLRRAIAADAGASAELVRLVTDAHRAKAPLPKDSDGTTPPDGGPDYPLLQWDKLVRPLLVDLELAGKRAMLTREPSRIAAGFLASVDALAAHPLAGGPHPTLLEAVAGRSLAAAQVHGDGTYDDRPLTTAITAAFAAAARGDLALAILDELIYITTYYPSLRIERNAGLACLGSKTLDAQRPLIARFFAEREKSIGGASSVWSANVLIKALGFSYTTANVVDIQGTYCKPDFLLWAEPHLGKERPPCAYGGVVFDSNDYCAK